MNQNQTDMPITDHPSHPPPPPPPEDIPPAPFPDAPTGDDAYAQRLRMSTDQPTNQAAEHAPPTPAPLPSKPQRPRPLDALQPESATICRAPVRYTLPPPPADIPASEAELEEVFAKERPAEDEAGEDAGRSLRPGQKGFAQRLLEKYGWTKGSGLGATGSGIVKPLQVKVEKQKKRPDSEGGGFVTPAGRGKIIGSAKKSEDEGKFGPMSEVIILKGMLDGMDLEAELEGDQDVGLMQEIGEECSEKVNDELPSCGRSWICLLIIEQYGRVERVFIHRNAGDSAPVFVKFTSQLSALRVCLTNDPCITYVTDWWLFWQAVNALEGRIFNGNAITARFFDKDKFEQGIYEE